MQTTSVSSNVFLVQSEKKHTAPQVHFKRTAYLNDLGTQISHLETFCQVFKGAFEETMTYTKGVRWLGPRAQKVNGYKGQKLKKDNEL